jgi:hypothetical protein
MQNGLNRFEKFCVNWNFAGTEIDAPVKMLLDKVPKEGGRCSDYGDKSSCFHERVSSIKPNEKEMSDDGRGRTSIGVEVWKSSQKWSVRRSAVRSIAWLGLCGFIGGRGATI